MKKRKTRFGIILAAALVCIVCLATIIVFFTKGKASSDKLKKFETQEITKEIFVNRVGKDTEVEVSGLELLPGKVKYDGNNELSENTSIINPTNEKIRAVISYEEGLADEDKKCTISYYRDDEQLWSAVISEYWVRDVNFCEDGIYAIGKTFFFSDEDDYAYFSKIDLNGQILFTCKLEHDSRNGENIVKVFDEGDGNIVVFSYENASKNIFLSRYDGNGNEISSKKIEMDKSISLHDVICLEEGYLIKVRKLGYISTELLYRLDGEGNISDGYYYSSEGNLLRVRDMVEYEGHVYISAYEVPLNAGITTKYEIEHILANYRQGRNTGDDSDEDLAEGLRDEYTADLFVCDEATGEPVKCFTIKGAKGDELSISEDNQLIWNTETIVYADFAEPTISSYSISGACGNCKYYFDKNGSPVGLKQDGMSSFIL